MVVKKTLFLALLACVVCGCIRENFDGCGSELLFQFRYTYNNQWQDLLTEEVHDIRVYLFDQSTNLLAQIIRAEKEEIQRGWIAPGVAEGVYTAIVWGASGEDMMLGGYVDAEMNDSVTLVDMAQVRIGVTSLDNFCVMLAYSISSDETEGMVRPDKEEFDDLFYAVETDIAVSKEKGRTVVFDFIKMTNILNIRITGLNHLSSSTLASASGQPLCVFVTAPCERYKYDYTMCDNILNICHEPSCKSLTDTEMEIDIKVQRLLIDYHTVRPVLLHIQSADTRQDMIVPLDVMSMILRAKDTQGGVLWSTQEAIDRQYVFPVEISILIDLSVRITVNGFEIVDVQPETGRS